MLFSATSAALATSPNIEHSDVFVRRVEILRHLLFYPQIAQRIVGEDWPNRVTGGDISNNTLFKKVAVVESLRLGKEFGGDAANTIGRQLRRRLKSEFNQWPRNLDAWALFLLNVWPAYLHRQIYV